jgi:hypothetical protein
VRALVTGIHEGRCRGCERRPKNGLSVYEFEDRGTLYVLCYRCAAVILAFLLGWRPDGWDLEAPS